MKKLLLAIPMLMGLLFLPNSSVQALEESVSKNAILRGNLEVDVNFSLPIANHKDTRLFLTLTDASGSQIQIPLNLEDSEKVSSYALGTDNVSVKIRKLDQSGMELAMGDSEITYYAFTFYQLKQGSYKVTLSGTGYKTVEVSKVELQNYSKRITLTNLKGNFEVGDFNQDGKVDSKDLDLLISNLNTKEASTILTYDLNRDGKVDIIDVSYIATVLNNRAREIQKIDTDAIIDSSTVKANGNIVSGSIRDLFTEKGSVTLAPEKNEPISSSNPVTLALDFNQSYQAQQLKFATAINASETPTEMEVIVLDEDGKTHTYYYKNEASSNRLRFSEEDGSSIVIDLGKQVAIKKVTIKVVGTANNTNLASIATVEFLNNVFKEIPKPTIIPPYNVKAVPGSEQVTVTWDYATNVTGYEVRIQVKDANNVYSTQVYQTTYNEYTIKDLDNYTVYTVSVQSTSGDWKSGYSSDIEVTPVPNRRPPAPEGVSIGSRYLSLQINWKKMKDTKTYNLFYRMKGETAYQVIRNIQGTSYLLTSLNDLTEYEVYLTGNNELGEGGKSEVYIGKTQTIEPPASTNYKRLNTSNGKGVLTNHIADVLYNNYDASLYPEGFNKFNIVDDDYTSHWTAPQGAWYNNGPTVVFDDAYEMDHFIFVPRIDGNFTSMMAAYSLQICDENGVWKTIVSYGDNIYPTHLGDGVYQVSFKKEKVKQIRFGITRAYAAQLSISEMKFYYYDSLEDDVDALFKDDLHIELKENVTLNLIRELEERANTKDSVSLEYHPNRDILLQELKVAKDILEDQTISGVITVKQNLTNNKNGFLGFAMSLNDYQPLGIVAKAGEKIVLYIGTENKTMPQLVFTQYYPESGQWTQTVANLKKGQNIVTVPKIGSMNTERGGSVYIRYPSSISGPEIKVRVSGGMKIPTLDLYGITGEEEQKNLIREYIIALKSHVAGLESYYQNQATTDADGKPLSNVYPYNERTSILNSTEIATTNVILSVPATKALQGIRGNSLEEEVNTLYRSMKAFEQLMTLAYTEKGLYLDADLNKDGKIDEEEAKHQYPFSRINIRYTRMFDGAFMYATGGHIGIELGSVASLMNGRPTETDQNGIVTSTGFFGWGISHEIGHVIDEGHRIFGETSNNILSLFAQTADDKQLSRLESSNVYSKIYQKVTSHTKGVSSDVFVSLGMFWQLHLAYDDKPNLEDTNSFYARLNRLYRTTTLTDDRNNLLIKLASDAAGKDLIEFFERWGLVASESTKEYIKEKGYQKENRAIYYLNDQARRHRLALGEAFSDQTSTWANLTYNQEGYGPDAKKVVLTFGVNANQSSVLGYEILRNGVPIAFVEAGTTSYTDVLSTLNNQTFNYEVIAYDYYLNKTASYRLDTIKMEHDGSVAKDSFNITSNRYNEIDKNTESDPHGPLLNSSVSNLLDGDKNTIFQGDLKASSTKEDPSVIVDFNRTIPIAGFKYTAGVVDGKLAPNTITNYQIYVSTDNENWTLVKTGNFRVTAENPTAIIYFDKAGVTGGQQLWTYNVSYIKIVAPKATGISGAEFDFIAPPGDNVDLSTDGIGVLEHDFQYGEKETDIINKGSIIFTGDYRGNPAFNELLLIDGEGNTVNGTAIFMAPLPDNDNVDEISKGTWIFVIDPEDYAKLHGKVKVNLYRVDDALSSTGQRFVSDTYYVTLPEQDKLPNITLTNSGGGNN